jgi:hypothetical protein
MATLFDMLPPELRQKINEADPENANEAEEIVQHIPAVAYTITMQTQAKNLLQAFANLEAIASVYNDVHRGKAYPIDQAFENLRPQLVDLIYLLRDLDLDKTRPSTEPVAPREPEPGVKNPWAGRSKTDANS